MNQIIVGDIGHFDNDGNYFVIDRLKELIKVKGFQVLHTFAGQRI